MAAVVHLTKCARLVGQKVYARGSTQAVDAFLGIPYAKPPVGDRRFQAPQPAKLWNGERDATQYGPICPQDMVASAKTHHPFPMPESVSEDCLYLNVWTPSTGPTTTRHKRAVMFWIYGGSFVQGFSNYYNGTVFAAQHDVVVVSINYRVGPFGFLSTGDNVVPGNAGLLDQVAALKWVRKYISQFGGDPENITVFGESAGSISTSLHLCSPLSRGLFRRVICQSGSALHPGSAWPQNNARKYLLKKVHAMGCQETDSKKILTFLNGFSGQDLVERLGGGFNPVIDHHFVTGPPADHYYTPTPNPPVDLMIGFNSHEGAQFIFALAKSKTISSIKKAGMLLELMISKMFFRGSPAGAEILRVTLKEYLKDVEVMTPEQLTEAVSAAYGDVLFVAPSVRTAAIHSSRSRTFMYQFRHRLSLSSYPAWVMADHGNEIPLVFGEPWLDRFPDVWSNADKLLSRTMMTYWANFAKTGNPNGADLPDWPEYNMKGRQYLQLQETPQVATDFEPVRMSLWNDKVEALESSQRQKSKY